MSLVNVSGGKRPYVGFYKGRRVEIHAINALAAQQEVAKLLGLPEKKRKEITVILADVVNDAASL